LASALIEPVVRENGIVEEEACYRGLQGQAESLAPFADDLAGRVQSGGEDLVREALGREEDDLGANYVAIR
jgi:hypothetical protein